MTRRSDFLFQLLNNTLNEVSQQQNDILSDIITIANNGIEQRGTGTLIINLDNDTTTFVSGSDIEGDIIDTEEEEDEEALKFLNDILEEINNNDWNTKVLVTLMDEKKTKTISLNR